ncbi:nucleotidyl transferase AbiEii/AbiGii toxin family protein [Enterococcus sp. BWB1-3]|uniref:nucleotidyl transferase AbiEii/AbiGii toxin family protein n=1 Tax=Enterococcus sp. BWB1-3 TaxID=2787713 RepID=UPI001924585A|nr:nucleotidyl transferase AbiEii/AbiGii toxin family protein [Enterococcus sp. BWB1-3]MBL1228273.1 nucleotidyl transferase AbiEii/AbiGii toxin family protein [Enterococcus sp. BWB1-3]
MLEFLKMKDADKKDIYRVVSEDLGMNEAILEKDYWVVLMLDILFTKSKFKHSFAFKGGTSLSKAYHQIQRFSEDIDLILDWQILGYGMDEPWIARSKNQQRKFNDEANERAARWIETELVPELNANLIDLGIENITLAISPTDIADKEISAYIVDAFPQLFDIKSVTVPTVEAKRTFWEKATILHKEAYRMNTQTPTRYSRHYYDIYQLAQSITKEDALNDLSLLSHVISFKQKFYADNSAHYGAAVPGTLKLLPNNIQMTGLINDYDSMKSMLFGEVPTFDVILNDLEQLESEINSIE